jgi:hypothetical protein
MDWVHAIVIASVAVSILAPIIGFTLMARMLRKDEAIDAAIFLAQRELQEYIRRNK